MYTLPGSHGRLSRRPHTAAITPVAPNFQAPVAFIIGGAPRVGKSAQASILSTRINGHNADLSEALSALEGLRRIELAAALNSREAAHAHNEKCLGLVVKEIIKANMRHICFVGLRGKWMLAETYKGLNNLGYEVVYIELNRAFDDCVRLGRKPKNEHNSGKEHTNDEIEGRLMEYFSLHRNETLQFFNSFSKIPQIHFDLVGESEDDEHDSQGLFEKIQSRLPGIKEWRSEPEPVLSQ